MLKQPGNGLMMDDPRATLTAMGKPPVRISPQPWAPLGEASPPTPAALEAVLRGTSKPMPARLAAVRLAIYAPRRFTELAGELCRHANAELRRATAWNLGMIAKHRPELISDPVRAALRQLARRSGRGRPGGGGRRLRPSGDSSRCPGPRQAARPTGLPIMSNGRKTKTVSPKGGRSWKPAPTMPSRWD